MQNRVKFNPRQVLLVGCFFILALVAACSQQIVSSHELQPKSIALMDGQSVLIQVNSGEVSISQSNNSNLEIGGTTNLQNGTPYELVQSQNEIEVISNYKPGLFSFSSQAPLKLTIQVPAKHKITITSFSALVSINNYNGDLDVSTVSGAISAHNINGNATLKSNRGDINFSDSTGELDVLGNYGILSLENLKGTVNSSTIMGTIKFKGIINSGDGVHLETDHAPIEIQLLPGSDLRVQIRSTSGNTTCLLPKLSVSPRNCDGVVGAGSGKLSVRTVSGDVTLQQLP